MFFSTVLPKLVDEQVIIRSPLSYSECGGDILLPFTTYFLGEMLGNIGILCQRFIISFVRMWSNIPLCKATELFCKQQDNHSLISQRDILKQRQYVGVTNQALEQSLRGTPSDNGIYEEFKKHIQNLDTIHYMRLKVVQGGDNVQDVGINHRAFSSYILKGDIETHFQDGSGGIYLADVGACESREECSAVSGTMDGTMATNGRKHYAQDKPAPIEKHWKQYYDTDIWNLYDNTTDVLSVDNGQDQQVIIALRKCYASFEQKTVNTIHFPVGMLLGGFFTYTPIFQ